MQTLSKLPNTSPQIPTFTGVRTLVMGLGRFGGGVGVTQWLARQGAIVTVTDQADPGSLAESLEAIADLPVTLRLGGHESCDLAQTDLVIINPAVLKSKSALFHEILRRKIPWTTEINLFCERCPAPVVGVTGSFGKSTTSAMLAHVLDHRFVSSGKPRTSVSPAQKQLGATRFSGVHLGGNIGRSLLADLPTILPTDLVVLEMSNAQLEDIARIDWAPAIAVITNLYPHHLDRYANFEEYAQAKLNLIRSGGSSCPVVHGEMDPQAWRWLDEAVGPDKSRLTPVEKADPPIDLLVPGDHNRANADCVLTVCRVMGLDDQGVRDSLRSFRGLPHRLELVGKAGGVQYINDSKSTAPAATIIALDALPDRHGRLITIVGGQKKDVPLEHCARALAQRCRMVIGCGQAGPAFLQAIKESSQNPACQLRQAGGVDEAVSIAAQEARSGDTVLFSPGAPSFDQYVNFTERGKHFATLVNALP